MQASNPSFRLLPHKIIHPLPNTVLNLIKLFRLNFRKGTTLAQLLRRKWNSFLGPFRLPHSASYQSQDDWESSDSFKIYPHHILHFIPSHPSTALLTQTSTPALGAPFLLFASSYGTFPQGHKLQYMMSKKHTGPSPSGLNSGQGLSSTWVRMTALQSTHKTALGWHQVVAYMASLVMQEPRSCAPMALVLSQNGLMITYFSGSSTVISRNTISSKNSGPRILQRTEEKSMMEAVSGSKGQSCKMTSLKNSMKICLLPSEISCRHQKGLFAPPSQPCMLPAPC